LTFLLDVNVIIALLDPMHHAHEDAHVWFEAEGARSWATCPMTENGALRIIGHPRYPGSPGSPAAVAEALKSLRSLPGHQFWPDDLSLLDPGAADVAQVLTSGQVTDTYLLALAVARGGRLATFDRRLSPAAVRSGKGALTLIGSAVVN